MGSEDYLLHFFFLALIEATLKQVSRELNTEVRSLYNGRLYGEAVEAFGVAEEARGVIVRVNHGAPMGLATAWPILDLLSQFICSCA